MSNAVTTPNTGGLAALQTLRKGLQQGRATIPSSVGGTPVLRLLEDGPRVVGSEDTVIRSGTEAIVNLMSFQSGYSCWTNRQPGQGKNELMGEEMWGIGAMKPPASTLPVHHDTRTQELCQWKDAMSVEFKMLDGAMKGQQVMYKTTSVGGVRAMSALLDAALAKIDEDTVYAFPIIRLASDSYNHNSYGRTYVPMLEIVGWADKNGNEEDGEDLAAVRAVDEVIKPEPVKEPEPVAAEPVGRRRRL